MKLQIILVTIGILFSSLAFAQVNKDVVDHYFDFNEAVAYAKYDDAFRLSKQVIADFDQLDSKMQVVFNNRYAKLHEEHGDKSIAISFYRKVVDAAPNYYVAQSALGHLYLNSLNILAEKINTTKENQLDYQVYQKEYKEALSKAIKHLEKAYACDPYKDLENLLKSLYLKAGVQKDVNTLKNVKASCQDILSDY